MFRHYVDKKLKRRGGAGLDWEHQKSPREVYANRYNGSLYCIQNFKENHINIITEAILYV